MPGTACREDENLVQSPSSAKIVTATSGPIP
jgi:hypothetical protein